MGLKIQYLEGATPLDPDDAQGLIPTHITTQRQLNEWEFINIVAGEEWAFSTRQRDVLSAPMVETLHQKMFGDTWRWAGTIRTKETLPVGVAPENIRPELLKLLADVRAQIDYRSLPLREIARRFHHLPGYQGKPKPNQCLFWLACCGKAPSSLFRCGAPGHAVR
jgi:Fic-DOC domain mobile mystery protein B